MVRGDSRCFAASCQLLFCTTGVLLQRLKEDPLIAQVTHLVVDEVRLGRETEEVGCVDGALTFGLPCSRWVTLR